MNIVHFTPCSKRSPQMICKQTTAMKMNKFENLKNKLVSFEKKRFSRLKDELKLKKTNLGDDIKEIDAIIKETLMEKQTDETELSIIDSFDEVQKENDSFFDN